MDLCKRHIPDMQQAFRKYSGKIMLFGEYSILEGSGALLLPYHKVKAQLKLAGRPLSDDAFNSNQILRSFGQYLELESKLLRYFNIPELKKHIDAGLYLDSTIPLNYGLGSSGALCASIYGSFSADHKVTEIALLQKLFAQMESFFHGSSSGADPLSIYLEKPLIIKKNEYIFPPYDLLSGNRMHVFLIDTGMRSFTGPLVKNFREQMAQDDYRQQFKEKYLPVVDKSVNEWQNGLLQEETIFTLSELQYRYFRNMIPHSFLESWKAGWSKQLYALKLCGSGGGGMILGFTADISRTRDFFLQHYSREIEII
jgi:mevalonate kinase